MTRAEQETIILTSEADDTYSIYTYNATLKRKLAEYADTYPSLCQKEKDDGYGGVTYNIIKDRVSINFKKPMSEEKRKELAKRFKK